jgi:hypothetical protein
MPDLTRRPHPERSDCWHIFYGDVQVGTIAVQPGLPIHAEQWRWDYGFYPASQSGLSRSGYASSFDQARADFRSSAERLRPACTETDFTEYRRQRAFTTWKYAMHDAGLAHVSVGHALLIWVTEWPQEDQTQTKFRRYEFS